MRAGKGKYFRRWISLAFMLWTALCIPAMAEGGEDMLDYGEIQEAMEDARAEGLSQGLSQGHQTGVEEERLASIRNLMRKTGWPVERTMEMLDIPEELWEKYLKLLEK